MSEFLELMAVSRRKGVSRHFLSPQEREQLYESSVAKMAVRKLKSKRKSLGWTQADLAARSNIPQTTISRIESGTWNISLRKIVKMAEAMGCMVDIDLVQLPSEE